MKSIAFATKLVALTLCALAITASTVFATEIVPIQGKYSKLKLDGICAANGGNSYGTATTAYGCSKNGNTVECDKKGNCIGYIGLKVQTGDKDKANVTSAVLQFTPER